MRVKERGAALKCAQEPTETPTIISEAAQRLVEAGRISFGAAVRSIVRPTPLSSTYRQCRLRRAGNAVNNRS